MTARELEALMVKTFGPDFRDKTLVGPVASFRLADAFEECGLQDPQRPPPPGGYGLWQMVEKYEAHR